MRPDDDGHWDDRHLKEALREGRLYGSFDVLGFPVGFDFHAAAGDDVTEMGGEVTRSPSLSLVATAPRVFGLDPAAEPPAVVVRLLRAREGGFDEVARSEGGTLTHAVSEPGAYRVEVRMIPFHLRDFLGDDAPVVLSNEYVWVYSNAIYVQGE